MSTLERSTEYYGLTGLFDQLYESSLNGKTFNKLYQFIVLKQNILLAYRNIKRNSGAKTPGVDDMTILDIEKLDENVFVEIIRDKLSSYQPGSVKRVYIPKRNGKKRPLGIPNLYDRIIQQAIKQVLEPIVEAKFFKHSYGFRPLRSVEQAMGRIHSLMNNAQLHYVVDVDIKGFFDNVNHNLLRRQIWNMGIRDTRLLSIISKILKAEIVGVGIPIKGTPQGGVLSPLLANIVLNDLDQWVASQWEKHSSKYKYSRNSKMYRALKGTELKEGYLVRYADDFKLLTRSHSMARRWYTAIKSYIEHRLKLEISPEKSGITNLRKKRTEFLGFEIRAVSKGTKYTARSYVSKVSKETMKEKLRKTVKQIQGNPGYVNLLNYKILGMHNYYRIATAVSVAFAEIDYELKPMMKIRLKAVGKYSKPHYGTSPTFDNLYSKTYRTWKIQGMWVYPIADIQFKIPINFIPGTVPYTSAGRNKYYKGIGLDIKIEMAKILRRRETGRTVEYMDNRLSRYVMVKGKCEVTGRALSSEEFHCHHIIPLSLGGTDRYDNLKIIHKKVHKIIHAVTLKSVLPYLIELQLTDNQLDKINILRNKCHLEPIK
ncbi:group II intron reverse transcriptase/maturase [Listeria sp. FSL L7-0091]|uniref:group II intron reverse transcriptase/maturase n=1 Tax=Listeria farberi TaxID=2713500 RepID=UPI001627D24A|nr:group II intron reverse transcriptase/maturase [Listeria farberi]MBC2262758.1 group II intron reverse transcriptase/maturase [Listeria farberi]